ncbi:thiamine pyrophosphate-dependent dehydrogenase E1 component subunit alpha [Algibacillus agarilyticus]|uniref:thiamine pyrophosphate-dependent dehydrogenase E1 component subunit alpha n=1 Tax=Algibacillus agarilyticus TaxID=2234133 RepID=UPI000DCF67D2|nr:thiamine pyrophosphate-dependent dehydrogenase E1 component subunit alpha [Algibacillus agarilyticus]
MSDLIELYRQTLRIRLVEEEIAKRYSEQKMRCPTHLSIGQEAVAVGVSSLLSNQDKAYSSHRAHAHYLAKGGCLNKLIAELYGKETGCTAGRGGSMHLSDLDVGFVASTAIVANSIPLAVGNALHQQVQKKAEISIAYFGDGATEEGAFYESTNFAAVKKLPILFVCENNQYSVYTPLKPRQPEGRSITRLAQEIGIKSIAVDGNDINQVINATQELLNHVRSGLGPALIECHTYRHREHCGPHFDDDLNYRPRVDIERWLANDPLFKMTQELAKQNNWSAIKADIEKELMLEIHSAFDFAENSPFPDPKQNNNYLYAN